MKKTYCDYAENKDGLLIEIDPPVTGQKYGLGDKDISSIILYAKFKGASLFPINEDPMHVKIYRILNIAVIETGQIYNQSDVKLWAWGEIYSKSKQL